MVPRLLILTAFFLFSCHYNLGHRLGGDVVKEYPENTIQGLTLLLKKYKEKSNFRYIEFDVQESSDTNLFVFHDETIERLIPYNKYGNENILNNIPNIENGVIKFNELKKKDILRLNLSQDSVKVPEFSDVLEKLKEEKYKGKTYIEVKSIKTEHGRRKFISEIQNYQDDLDLYVLVFKENFIKSFPGKKKWCTEFIEKKIPVIKVGFHTNVC